MVSVPLYSILTIVHQLNIVVKSDWIIILHQDMIVDFDNSQNILPKHGLIQQVNNNQLIKKLYSIKISIKKNS